jgi:sterol desaturase/sphingolipid hydroxylase (fatty acid hydroxylase superfamily)
MFADYRLQLLQIWATPIYAVLILGELLIGNFRHRRFYTLKETAVNMYLNLLNFGLDLMLRGAALLLLTFVAQHKLLTIPAGPAYWVALFLLVDMAFYFEHRVDHFCRIFWAVHVTHHSSEEYNLSTGFRSSVLMPFYKYFYLAPIALLGLQPIDIIFMFSALQVYGILVHTQTVKKLPRWIEYIFVTPSHHRVHHASNAPYLDKNMGMTLIIWDRIFGTFAEELPDEAPRYGLTKPLDNPHHPTDIIFHEWKAIGRDLKKKISFRNKLRYLFMPPGWAHDGSGMTSKDLRAAWLAEKERRKKRLQPKKLIAPKKEPVLE